MEIKKLIPDEPVPLDLLHLADPSEEAARDFLVRGTCYTAHTDGKTVGVYVLLPTRPFTGELVNLAVREQYQGRGIGKTLVEHCIGSARASGHRILEVGTGNAGIMQMAFYQKCGFSITHIEPGLFTKLYKNPICENGIVCRDMVRMRMFL